MRHRLRAGLILVKGPRQIGKSSLLARGLDYARHRGSRVILTDLQTLGSDDLVAAATLFKAVGRDVAAQLGLRSSITAEWSEEDSPNTNFSRYVQRAVLGSVDGPVVRAVDEVDRLLGRQFASDVFGLFRAWYNRRALDPAAPWSRLTLVIAYATEAHLFISDVNQSPFNVGIRLSLDDFTPAEVAERAGVWKVPVSGGAEIQVHDFPDRPASGKWVMTEKGVFFAGRQDGRRTLFFLDFALQRARPVAALTSGRLFGRIDVSPDGLWLLASIIDEGIADLKLIEGFR